MQNDFLMTVKRFPGKLTAKGKQDKSELIKHIFAKASSIQDRLSALEAVGGSIDMADGEAPGAMIERPEWRDHQYLVAALREYVRLGHVLCSTDSAFGVRGICVLDVEKLMTSLTKGPHISRFHILPKISIQPHIPRLFRESVQIAPLIEMLLQVLMADQTQRNAELSILMRRTERQCDKDTDCKLIVQCVGVRTAPGLTVAQFEKIAKELTVDVWNNWHLLGTRLVACVVSCHTLGGSLRALAIDGDTLDFEVMLPMALLAETSKPKHEHKELLIPMPLATS